MEVVISYGGSATSSTQKPFKLVVSQRGNPQIIHEGYTYTKYKDLKSTGEQGWRCTQKTCKARVCTLDETINRKEGTHSHPPLDEDCLNFKAAKNLVNHIKRAKGTYKPKKKYQSKKKEFSDPDDPTDNSAFHDALQPPDIEIDVGPIFETVDIKPNIELDNLPPPPPSPPPKRKRTAAPDVEVEEEEEQDPLAIKRTRSSPLVGYGEDNDKEDDDNFSGDEFDEEEDGDKVRRAYQLLKSVFDKKDKYDIFGHRLAARLRALKSAKVCRHVQDILESVIDDAEAGKYNNV